MSDEHVPAIVDVKASHVGMFKLRICFDVLVMMLYMILVGVRTYIDLRERTPEGPHLFGFGTLVDAGCRSVILALLAVNFLSFFGSVLVTVIDEGLILKYSHPALGRWAKKEWRVVWDDIVGIYAKTNKQGQVQMVRVTYFNRSNSTFSRCDALDDLYELLKRKIPVETKIRVVRPGYEGPGPRVVLLVFFVLLFLLCAIVFLF